MKTREISITEEQFWQLVGLITAGKELRKQQEVLETSYRNITGEGELSRFSDYIYEDRNIIDSLKEHLPYDKVTIRWNKKEKTLQGECP